MTDPIIYASPAGGERLVFDITDGGAGGRVAPARRMTFRLQDAIDRAAPGQTVRLTPGVYDEPVVVPAKGEPDRPVCIAGSGQVTLDGRRNSVRPRNVDRIGADDFAFIRIIGCAGLRIENLTLQNCWPTAIYLADSTDIHLNGLNLNGATYGIFAKGESTRRILVEHCAWLQDPQIWNGVEWTQIHDDPTPRRELDGDFFRSWRIAGDVVIRNNYISHAFNGIHLYALHADGADRGGKGLNDNVWIYENTFSFIRDNAVEAENLATNWFVFANRILNCHIWLAFENAEGGYWYVFGNRGWFTQKAGPASDCNNGGGVIKASNNKRFPKDPYYYFNNSFYVRGPYIKKGVLKNFRHFNNALEFARARYHQPGVVTDGRNPFASSGPDPACDGTEVVDAPFTKDWTKNNVRFFGDVVDHPLYPDELRRSGWPVEGVGANPGFETARSGGFTLLGWSPCNGTGLPETLAMSSGGAWTLPAGLNCGALRRPDRPYTAADLGCPAQPPTPRHYRALTS